MKRDVHARLQALAEDWALPAAAPAQLAILLELVSSEPTAITTVRDPAQAVERHVADSLRGLAVPAVRSARTLADLGSGAGFPGLVLAVALPGATVTLIESVGKKADFLRRAAAAAALETVTVVADRVESWPGAADAVTARALASLPVLVEYAAPILQPGGTAVFWKGAPDRTELAAGAAAAAIVGLTPEPALAPDPGDADGGVLCVYRKTAPTPDRFPRRPGMARKRPLAS